MGDEEKAIAMAEAFRPLASLNRFPCISPELSDESEHFIICVGCGQAIDCRRLGDVFHHEEPGHEPLAVN